MPSRVKKHCEGTEPQSCQTAKMFFFLPLLFFRQASSKLHDSFTMVFTQNICYSQIRQYIIVKW